MILSFLRERLSWILFFIALQLLALILGAVDTSLSMEDIYYYNLLSLILFVILLGYRYKRETLYYRQIKQREIALDLTSTPEATSPFEKMVEQSLTEELEHLKQKAVEWKGKSEQKQEELLAWIHEVKTPLTAIHLIIQRIEDAKIKRQLTYEWMRIHLLLDQQLHDQRLPSIENDLYMEKVQLEPLINQELRMLQGWFISKGLGVEVDLKVKSVLTDSKWTAFILRQLLSNAVKYSNEGEIRVSSYLSDDHVILKVRDTGTGITARDLPRIFDKGFTSTSTHHSAKATGMGLYLAKRAADSLHIRLNVTSSPGDGTEVTLTFPKQNDFVQLRGM